VCIYLGQNVQSDHVAGYGLPALKDTGFWVGASSIAGGHFVSVTWAYTAP
jgi:hypothetical protein